MGATKIKDISARVDEIINLHKEKAYDLTPEERKILRSYSGHGGGKVLNRGVLDDQIPQPKREESKVDVFRLVRMLKNRIKILNEIK